LNSANQKYQKRPHSKKEEKAVPNAEPLETNDQQLATRSFEPPILQFNSNSKIAYAGGGDTEEDKTNRTPNSSGASGGIAGATPPNSNKGKSAISYSKAKPVQGKQANTKQAKNPFKINKGSQKKENKNPFKVNFKSRKSERQFFKAFAAPISAKSISKIEKRNYALPNRKTDLQAQNLDRILQEKPLAFDILNNNNFTREILSDILNDKTAIDQLLKQYRLPEQFEQTPITINEANQEKHTKQSDFSDPDLDQLQQELVVTDELETPSPFDLQALESTAIGQLADGEKPEEKQLTETTPPTKDAAQTEEIIAESDQLASENDEFIEKETEDETQADKEPPLVNKTENSDEDQGTAPTQPPEDAPAALEDQLNETMAASGEAEGENQSGAATFEELIADFHLIIADSVAFEKQEIDVDALPIKDEDEKRKLKNDLDYKASEDKKEADRRVNRLMFDSTDKAKSVAEKAKEIPGEIESARVQAEGIISAAASVQKGAISDAFGGFRSSVQEQQGGIISQIETQHQSTVTAIETTYTTNRGTVEAEYGASVGAINAALSATLAAVESIYNAAAAEMRSMGADFAAQATALASAAAADFRAQVNDDAEPDANAQNEAKAEAAEQTGQSMAQSMIEQANAAADALMQSKAIALQEAQGVAAAQLAALEAQYSSALQGLEAAKQGAIQQVDAAKASNIEAVNQSVASTLQALDAQEAGQQEAIDNSSSQSIAQINEMAAKSTQNLLTAALKTLEQFRDDLIHVREDSDGSPAPAKEELDARVKPLELKLQNAIEQIKKIVEDGLTSAKEGILSSANQSAAQLANISAQAISGGQQAVASFSSNVQQIVSAAQQAFSQAQAGHEQESSSITSGAVTGFQQTVASAQQQLQAIEGRSQSEAAAAVSGLQGSLSGMLSSLAGMIASNAASAAAAVPTTPAGEGSNEELTDPEQNRQDAEDRLLNSDNEVQDDSANPDAQIEPEDGLTSAEQRNADLLAVTEDGLVAAEEEVLDQMANSETEGGFTEEDSNSAIQNAENGQLDDVNIAENQLEPIAQSELAGMDGMVSEEPTVDAEPTIEVPEAADERLPAEEREPTIRELAAMDGMVPAEPTIEEIAAMDGMVAEPEAREPTIRELAAMDGMVPAEPTIEEIAAMDGMVPVDPSQLELAAMDGMVPEAEDPSIKILEAINEEIEGDEHLQAAITIDTYYGVFDNPNDDTDGKVLLEDFEDLSKGTYDRDLVVTRLEEDYGVAAPDIDATIAEIEAAATLVVNDTSFQDELDNANASNANSDNEFSQGDTTAYIMDATAEMAERTDAIIPIRETIIERYTNEAVHNNYHNSDVANALVGDSPLGNLTPVEQGKLWGDSLDGFINHPDGPRYDEISYNIQVLKSSGDNQLFQITTDIMFDKAIELTNERVSVTDLEDYSPGDLQKMRQDAAFLSSEAIEITEGTDSTAISDYITGATQREVLLLAESFALDDASVGQIINTGNGLDTRARNVVFGILSQITEENVKNSNSYDFVHAIFDSMSTDAYRMIGNTNGPGIVMAEAMALQRFPDDAAARTQFAEQFGTVMNSDQGQEVLAYNTDLPFASRQVVRARMFQMFLEDPSGFTEKLHGRDGSAFTNQELMLEYAKPNMREAMERGDAPYAIADETALDNFLGFTMNQQIAALDPNMSEDELRDLELAISIGVYEEESLFGDNSNIVKVRETITELAGDGPYDLALLPIQFSHPNAGPQEIPLYRIVVNGQDVFIDTQGNHYVGFDKWEEYNQLPPGNMTYPRDGHISDQGNMVSRNTPKTVDTTSEYFFQTLDWAALVGGVAAAPFTGGLSTAIVVTSGVYAAGRGLQELHALSNRGGSINPLQSWEAAGHWLNVGSGVFGGASRLARTTSLLDEGSAFSRFAIAGERAADIGGAINDIDTLIRNWESLPPEHRAFLAFKLFLTARGQAKDIMARRNAALDSGDLNSGDIDTPTNTTDLDAPTNTGDVDAPSGVSDARVDDVFDQYKEANPNGSFDRTRIQQELEAGRVFNPETGRFRQGPTGNTNGQVTPTQVDETWAQYQEANPNGSFDRARVQQELEAGRVFNPETGRFGQGPTGNTNGQVTPTQVDETWAQYQEVNPNGSFDRARVQQELEAGKVFNPDTGRFVQGPTGSTNSQVTQTQVDETWAQYQETNPSGSFDRARVQQELEAGRVLNPETGRFVQAGTGQNLTPENNVLPVHIDVMEASPELAANTENQQIIADYATNNPNSIDAIRTNFENLTEEQRPLFLSGLENASSGSLDLPNARRATPAEVAAAVRTISEHRTANNSRNGNYGYLEGNVGGTVADGTLVRSGAPDTDVDQIFEPLAVNSQNQINGENAWVRTTDSEYKMLNRFANEFGAQPGKIYPDATGTLTIVSERTYCPSCAGVIQQFNEMFPNINLILIDGVK